MCINHPFRNTYLSKHHLIPKVRGGFLCPANTLRLWRDTHDHWHRIFGNATISEIVSILSQHPWKYHYHRSWDILFKGKEIREVLQLLERVVRIKRKQHKRSHKKMLHYQ